MRAPSPTAGAWVHAARVWAGALGRAGFRRALPAWLGVAIVGGAVFGGNGLGPRDVAALAVGAPRLVLVVALAWLVLLTPAVRAAVAAPGLDLLRSLPGAPGLEAMTRVLVALGVHAPWAAIAIPAGGAVGALSWLAMATTSLAVTAAAQRWVRAPGRPRWRAPVPALIGVHLRAIVRRRGGSLGFAAGLALLAGALGAAMVHSAQVGAGASAALVGACGAVAIACGLAAIATVVVEDRRALTPWLAAASAGAAVPIAAVVVLASVGTSLGALTGATAIALGAPSAAHVGAIVAIAAAVGLGLGLAMTAVAGRAATTPNPGQAIAAGAAGLALASVIAIGVLALTGVAAIVGVGAGLAAGAPRR
ncbi:MAG: hypothetical protein IPL61_25430 [Myxococcales bacterium]|nr:hypothetical protein [Myxococcales bacterium]